MESGVSYSLLLFLALLNGFAIWIEIRLRSPFVVFWAALVYFFALPHIVEAAFGMSDYSSEVLNEATLFAVGFAVVYMCVRLGLRACSGRGEFQIRWRDPIRQEKSFQHFLQSLIMIWLLGTSMNVFLTACGSDKLSIFDLTWTDRRDLATHATLVLGFFTIAGAPTYLLAIRSRKYGLSAILIFANLLWFLFSRSRASLISFFIPLLLYTFYGLDRRKRIPGAIVVGAIMMFTMVFLIQVRYQGSLRDWLAADQREIIDDGASRLWELQGEFKLRKYWYFFIDRDNNLEGFGEGRTYWRLLLFPIPQSVLSLKPSSFTHEMARAYYGFSNGSIHPTLYGDLYGNFGFFGFCGAAFYAALAHGIDLALRRCSTEFLYVVLGALGSSLVLVPRGSVYNGVVQTVVAGALVWLVYQWTLALSCRRMRLTQLGSGVSRPSFPNRSVHAKSGKRRCITSSAGIRP